MDVIPLGFSMEDGDFFESQRDSGPKPMVATPGATMGPRQPVFSNPNGVVAARSVSCHNPVGVDSAA